MLDRIGAAARNPKNAVRPVTAINLLIERKNRVLLDVAEAHFSGANLTAVVGPNGAGKSLLLKVIAGVLAPDRGIVLWGGKVPSRAQYSKLSLLLQSPVLLKRSVLGNIEFALKAAGVSRREIGRRSRSALEDANLMDIANTHARLISGGEKQRLALARAMAIEPEVLLLDEPVAALDPSSMLAIEAMICTARERGTTVVLVTHDLAQARRLGDRIIFMLNGRIAEQGDTAGFFRSPQTREAKAFVRGEIVI